MSPSAGAGDLVLVIGGTRSGKSAIAEAIAMGSGDAPVTYVATAVGADAADPEMAARVEAHRRRRPASWTVVETTAVGGAIADAPGPVLVDSVGTWVQARMEALDLWDSGALDGLVAETDDWLPTARGRVVVVAEQVGAGLLPVHPGARRWVDAVGAVTAALAARADRVLLVVAGRAIDLPPVDADAHPRRDVTSGATEDDTAAGRDAADAATGRPEPDDLGVLAQHGDQMVPDGSLDLAVNVVAGQPPRHIRAALAGAAAGRYPDAAATARAVAEHTGLTPDHVVLLAGAAEAFWLIPHALRPRHGAVVHPTFTAPEAALRACGIQVTRVPRDAADGWALRPDRVPEDADIVVVGNPNNPTGTLDEPGALVSMCRPGRTVVVDEAFMDFVVDDRSSLAGRVDQEGLVVVRSVTKLWGVPGLRAGYLLTAPDVAATLRRHQQPWPVSAPALAVIEAALREESWRVDTATGIARRRRAMLRRLERIPGVRVHDGAANFVLLEVAAGAAVHRALLARGIAVRPSTFPLLPARFLRVAVQDAAATELLAAALEEIL